MGKTLNSAAEILAKRLTGLIGEDQLKGAPMRIEKLAAKEGMTIAHSTLQRMLNGEGANLEKLEAVASYFQTDVWRLLSPEVEPHEEPELTRALGLLSNALQVADELTLDQVRPLLARLVDEPNRAGEIVPRLAALLDKPPVKLAVETRLFAGVPPQTDHGRTAVKESVKPPSKAKP